MPEALPKRRLHPSRHGPLRTPAVAAVRCAWTIEPFRPPIETAQRYTLEVPQDLVAGLTVSVVEVPQAMAYAGTPGVPPQYGVYTSVIQGVIGALLSSSERMTPARRTRRAY